MNFNLKIAALIIAALVLCCPVASAVSFSDEEISKLAAGEMITRTHPSSGKDSLVGGTSFVLIGAPPQIVWQQFNRIDTWNQVYPYTYESRAIARKDNAVAVKLRVGVPLLQGDVVLTMVKKPETFEAVTSLKKEKSTPLAQDVQSKIRFVAQPGNKTLVIYSVLARTPFSALTAVLGAKVITDLERVLLSLPERLKKWMEKSGTAKPLAT